MSNTPKDLTKKKLTQAIEGSLGNVSEAARQLGCSRRAVYAAIERHDLKNLLQEVRQVFIDIAESALLKRINGYEFSEDTYRNGELVQTVKKHLPPDTNAICFALKTIGRAAGWGEKTTIEHSGSMAISFNPKEVSAKMTVEQKKEFLKCNDVEEMEKFLIENNLI